jgi:hypothetical protein
LLAGAAFFADDAKVAAFLVAGANFSVVFVAGAGFWAEADFLVVDADFLAGAVFFFALEDFRDTPEVTRFAAAAVLPAIFRAVARAMDRGPLDAVVSGCGYTGTCGVRHTRAARICASPAVINRDTRSLRFPGHVGPLCPPVPQTHQPRHGVRGHDAAACVQGC